MTDADQKTISLVEVFKFAQQEILAYEGSERLHKQVTDCEHGISKKFPQHANRSDAEMDAAIAKRNKVSILSIQGSAAFAVLHGLFSQGSDVRDDDTPSIREMVLENEVSGEDNMRLLNFFANDMFCTKDELAQKLKHLVKYGRASEDRPGSDPEDRLHHQEEAHISLLAKAVAKAIEQRYGIGQQAAAARTGGEGDLPAF